MKKTFKPGDNVWFVDQYDNVCHGVVESETISDNPMEYIHVKEAIGDRYIRADICFPTKEACLDNAREQHDTLVKIHLDSMRSIDDLVIFCLTHVVANAEEYTDRTAREAAIVKACELGVALPEDIQREVVPS